MRDLGHRRFERFVRLRYPPPLACGFGVEQSVSGAEGQVMYEVLVLVRS